MLRARAYAVFIDYDDLARFNIAQEIRANRVKGAAFRCKHICAAARFSDAERAEPVRVAHADELGGRSEHQGICALKLVHRLAHRLFDGRRLKPLLHDHIGDGLRVAGGLENGAAKLQLLPQLLGIYQVAVVRDRHAPLAMVYHNGLRVAALAPARGAIAHMAYRNVAMPEPRKCIRVEHLVDKSVVLMIAEQPVIVYNDAAALLPAMLQRIKCIISKGSYICPLLRIYAEHAALFMDLMHAHFRSPTPCAFKRFIIS